MGVEFRLLGPIEVAVDGRLVDVGHLRQLSVLAIMLVEANELVSPDQLVDRVWGGRSPHTARNTLYGYLHRLRKILADVPGVDITRRSGGYVLTVAPESVDLHRFRQLVGAARTAGDERALALLDEALGLCRGEAFPGLSSPWLDSVRVGLDQDRLTAELDRADLALKQNRHGDLVPVLATLADRHPLDERLAGQLMLALYRTGRQADALGRYEDTRRRLVDELGTDPGVALRELHQRILAGDASLDVTRHAPAASQVPRQLPARPGSFSGRAGELALLDKALAEESTTNIVAVTGAGGIGKTWLTLAWAYRAIDRFPDGQLYVDLRGVASAGDPASPHGAVRGLLVALGVDAGAVPADPDAQTALYRSVLAGRRVLIVLDDAYDTEQILPLLPGDPNCVVLVSSRHRLAGLAAAHGAVTVTLDVLTDAEAEDVLVGHLGRDRMAAEPDAVAALLTACAGLPLAISIVAARAATQRDFPLGVLAAELQDEATRLDALDTGDLTADLRAVFAASHRALTPDAQTLFGLLGVVPGPDIAQDAVAVLADESPQRTRVLLRELERAHLVRQHVPGRYRMHDLTRLYAVEQAGPDTRTAALRRLVGLYLHTAYLADHEVNPYHERMSPEPDITGVPVRRLPDRAAALAWFDSELPGLLAIQRDAADEGWHIQAWQFAWALDGYLWRGGHLLSHVAAWRIGLSAAHRLGDHTIQARAHRRLGHSFARAEQDTSALEHLDHALAAAVDADDLMEQARTHDVLAWLWARRGDDRQALEHANHTLRRYQELDLPPRIANGLNTVGWYHAQLGEYDQARDHCEQALALHRRHEDLDGEACTLDSLGYIALKARRAAESADHYRAALDVFRRIGNRYEEANTLANLGDAYEAMGERAEARTVWRQALDGYRAQRRTQDVDRVHAKLQTD
ncbi:AfsR/SARP family transcriptional regulator [Actinophytocola sp.]|uniref:AfsR/SARP family transcriptional regulator n=1 Tax=Actinophytocola sp. TaxID=1872138 RepID=UPI002ED27385